MSVAVICQTFLQQVSLAALKSLQEMLQAGRSSTVVSSGSSDDLSSSSSLQSPLPEDSIANWNTAWKVSLHLYLHDNLE